MELMTESIPHLIVLDPAERAELTRLTKYGPGGGEAKVIMSLPPGPQRDNASSSRTVRGPVRSTVGSGTRYQQRLIDPSNLPNVLRTAGYIPSRLDDSPAPGQHGWGIVERARVRLGDRDLESPWTRPVEGLPPASLRSPPFPGTVDIREHLSRHAARPDKLVTVARRLTTDIPRNSALAAATGILLRLPLHPEARGRLRRVAAAMASISAPPMSTSQVESLIGEHRHARYDPSAQAQCARPGWQKSRVLRCRNQRGLGPVLDGQSVGGVVLAWARYNNPGLRVEAHGFALLDDRPEPRAQADVVVFEDNQPTMLYDAKYKKSGPCRRRTIFTKWSPIVSGWGSPRRTSSTQELREASTVKDGRSDDCDDSTGSCLDDRD